MGYLPVDHEVDLWAIRTPQKMAVLDGRQSLTYADLAAGANRLGQALVSCGVVPGDRVAFCLPRSVHCLTALLGCLRAGAAYLPIDPKAPVPRLQAILADSAPRAVIGDAAGWRLLQPVLPAVPFLCLGTPPTQGEFTGVDQGRIDASPAERPAVGGAGGDALAYVLYTSGSTGVPKGVMVTHRNVRSYIDWSVSRFAISSADRLLATAPFHFDMSVFDVFASLRSGACLCIASEGLQLFPEKLLKFMEKEGVTLWKGISSLLMYLARAGVLRPGRLPALSRVLFGGEVLPTGSLIEWMNAFPEKEFYNVYGPTEATGISLFHRIATVPDPGERLPIGIPCDDTRTYLLDEELRPVADGEAGELFIGGAGVARGYLNDPEKSARVFLPDPYRPGERIYRSGDLARRRPDGTFEFLGRLDHQVKVMGYRIELGEIEEHLLAHPRVREAAVALLPAGAGLEELTAFVAADIDPAILLENLRRRLPAYMVPRRLLPVSRLPRCTRGKLDRQALIRQFTQEVIDVAVDPS